MTTKCDFTIRIYPVIFFSKYGHLVNTCVPLWSKTYKNITRNAPNNFKHMKKKTTNLFLSQQWWQGTMCTWWFAQYSRQSWFWLGFFSRSASKAAISSTRSALQKKHAFKYISWNKQNLVSSNLGVVNKSHFPDARWNLSKSWVVTNLHLHL